MKCQNLFFRKIRENISKCRLLQFYPKRLYAEKESECRGLRVPVSRMRMSGHGSNRSLAHCEWPVGKGGRFVACVCDMGTIYKSDSQQQLPQTVCGDVPIGSAIYWAIYGFRTYGILTHWRLESLKRVNDKQCRPRSDVVERGVWSGSPLFANSSTVFL